MILVDAGPLIALVDRGDQHHAACVAALKTLNERLGTIWPAITEALYLLAGAHGGQEAVWELVTQEAVELLPLDLSDVPRIRELMLKYADLPMDFADAALVRVAEREGVRRFFTIDRQDFSVYRLNDRIRPVVIP